MQILPAVIAQAGIVFARVSVCVSGNTNTIIRFLSNSCSVFEKVVPAVTVNFNLP